MQTSPIGHSGFFIALVFMVYVGISWAQSNDRAIADRPSGEEMIASIKEMSAWCMHIYESGVPVYG